MPKVIVNRKRRGGDAAARRFGLALAVCAVAAIGAGIAAWRLPGRPHGTPGLAGGVDTAPPMAGETPSDRGAGAMPAPLDDASGEKSAPKRDGNGDASGKGTSTTQYPNKTSASRPGGSPDADDAPPAAPPAAEESGKEKRRRIFSTSTEQVISGFANTRPGYPPPMLMRMPPAEDLEAILDKPIDIYDDDDERVAEAKENCARMKEELKQYISEGGTAENFLLWYHNELSKDYEEWKSAQHHVVRLLRDGDLEGAERYAAEKNAELTGRGVRNVTLPEALVERLSED